MGKKFKAKKRLNSKRIFYFILIVVFICLIRFYVLRIRIINSNTDFIRNVLENSNYYSNNGSQSKNFIKDISDYVSKNIFNSPTNILKSQLIYKSDSSVEISDNIEDENKSSDVALVVQDNNPIVYIYNSHQGETYNTKYLEEYNIAPDVIMASNMLKEKLEDNGIKTLVEQNDIIAYMKSKNLDHSGSYIASRYFLKKVMDKYDSIKLYIDLHRDAATHSATYTNINGKDYAKVLFVIGLENKNYEENLKVTNTINDIISKKYPTLTRGIMKKEGYGVNGVYNQDLDSNIILLEVGGNENNIDEVNNTLDLVAHVIGEYLNEKK